MVAFSTGQYGKVVLLCWLHADPQRVYNIGPFLYVPLHLAMMCCSSALFLPLPFLPQVDRIGAWLEIDLKHSPHLVIVTRCLVMETGKK